MILINNNANRSHFLFQSGGNNSLILQQDLVTAIIFLKTDRQNNYL